MLTVLSHGFVAQPIVKEDASQESRLSAIEIRIRQVTALLALATEHRRVVDLSAIVTGHHQVGDRDRAS